MLISSSTSDLQLWKIKKWTRSSTQGCQMPQPHMAGWRKRSGTTRTLRSKQSARYTEQLSSLPFCMAQRLGQCTSWRHKLNTYMMRHLQQILNVKWWDFISNADILTRANLPSMYELLIQRNLRWVGHIHRMDDSRLPKQILYSQLKEGLPGIGRPRLRFKNTVKRNLKDKIPVGS